MAQGGSEICPKQPPVFMKSPQDWFGSDFAAADLDGQDVDYCFPGDDGRIYTGKGLLLATQESGRLRVRIMYDPEHGEDSPHSLTEVFIILAADAKTLVRNLPGSKTPYSFRMQRPVESPIARPIDFSESCSNAQRPHA